MGEQGTRERESTSDAVAVDSAGVYLGMEVADFEARSPSARPPLPEDLPPTAPDDGDER